MPEPTKEQVEQLWALHNSKEAKAERLLRSYGFDDTRKWVDDSGYRLSDRIWRARGATREQIDDLIKRALASGEDALELADKLEQYLNPELAPVRNQLGRLVRNQKPSIVTSWPGRGGMGSFSARRLARTEITRAHGQATIEVAKLTPFATGVKWNLSARHPKPDECDANAHGSSKGLPNGVYAPDDVPRYPNHPMDLCYLTTETEQDIDKITDQLREQYGLAGEGETVAPDIAQSRQDVTTQTPLAPTFKTKDDVRGFLKSLGVHVDGTLGNVKTWQLVGEAFAKEQASGATFPPVISFGGGGKRSVAQFSQSFDPKTGALLREKIEIRTGGTFWKDVSGETQEQFDAGYWSSNDPLHAVIHENAHFRHRQIAPQGDAYGYTIEINGVKTYDRWLGQEGAIEVEIAKRVSRYAAKTPSEFVAETYAGIRAGNVYDDEIMNLYRKWGGPSL